MPPPLKNNEKQAWSKKKKKHVALENRTLGPPTIKFTVPSTLGAGNWT